MKVVKVDSVIGELKFQKNEMVKFMRGWSVNEETIDMAVDYFDTAIHGVEDHLEHHELTKN